VNQEAPTHIVNVKEMKRKKKIKNVPDIKEPIGRWLLYGLVISAFFALLGIINLRFLYLTPLGIIIGVMSWGIKKLFNRWNLKDYLR
jgi:hypothetical protein